MPIREYVDESGILHERIYLAGEEVPRVIEVEGSRAYLVVSAPTIRFKGPFSGGTPKREMVTELKPGHEVLDDGGKRRMKELKEEAEAKRQEKRKKFLAEQLSTYDV